MVNKVTIKMILNMIQGKFTNMRYNLKWVLSQWCIILGTAVSIFVVVVSVFDRKPWGLLLVCFTCLVYCKIQHLSNDLQCLFPQFCKKQYINCSLVSLWYFVSVGCPAVHFRFSFSRTFSREHFQTYLIVHFWLPPISEARCWRHPAGHVWGCLGPSGLPQLNPARPL